MVINRVYCEDCKHVPSVVNFVIKDMKANDLPCPFNPVVDQQLRIKGYRI